MSKFNKTWEEFTTIHTRLCEAFGVRKDVTEMYFEKEFRLPGAREMTARVTVSGQTFESDEDVFRVRLSWYGETDADAALGMAHLSKLMEAQRLCLEVENIVKWFRIPEAEITAFREIYKPARALYLAACEAERARNLAETT